MKVRFVKPIIVSGSTGRELYLEKEVSGVPCCKDTVLVNVGEGKQTETVASARLDVSTGIYSIILAGEPLKFDNLGAVSDFEHANKGWKLEALPTDPPSRGKAFPDGRVDDGTGRDIRTGQPINPVRSDEDLRREAQDDRDDRAEAELKREREPRSRK